MDPNTSIGRLCLGENNQGSVAEGEFYFVKFIVNPEEEDVEPSVIFGRSFMRLTKGIADFRNGIITIHPELDSFLDNSEETEKFHDDWDYLLDIDFGDIPKIDEAGLPPFVYKIGKSKRNKKRALESFLLCYYDVGPSLSNGKHLTRKENAWEALAIDICKRFFILEEERPIIKTMAYSHKSKEKEDPGALVIPIRLEAKIDLNALPNTVSDINVIPFRIYAKLDMPIDRDASILVGRGFLYTCGSILNTRDMITSTFDGVFHQTLCAAKTSLNTEESDNDDEEDYGIQRNSFGAPIYGPKPVKYLNCFLRSLPVPLQHMEWKPDYEENFNKKEEGDGQWHAEIRLTDPTETCMIKKDLELRKRSIKCAEAKCGALHKEVQRTLDRGERELNAEVKYGALQPAVTPNHNDEH
ncbi:hypothetical protein Tco_0812655 [Tanacetum coccineum]